MAKIQDKAAAELSREVRNLQDDEEPIAREFFATLRERRERFKQRALDVVRPIPARIAPSLLSILRKIKR